MLRLLQVVQNRDYATPFDTTLEGFHPTWWGPTWHLTQGAAMDHFVFTRGSEEVARAQVMPVAAIDPSLFMGHSVPSQIVSIERINVRQDLRLGDIGREAVSALVDHYDGEQLGAFALGGSAERFWAHIGWIAFRRRSGERGDPLFCSP